MTGHRLFRERCIYIYIYTHVYIYIYTHLSLLLLVLLLLLLLLYIYIYIYTYTCIYIYIYIYTHTHSDEFLCFNTAPCRHAPSLCALLKDAGDAKDAEAHPDGVWRSVERALHAVLPQERPRKTRSPKTLRGTEARKESSTYNGFHSAFAALFSYLGVLVLFRKIRSPSRSTSWATTEIQIISKEHAKR